MSQPGKTRYRVADEFQSNSVEFQASGKSTRRFTGSFTGTLPPLNHNLLEILHLEVEPMVGIEPTTYGLRNRCSTTELHWLPTRCRICCIPLASP